MYYNASVVQRLPLNVVIKTWVGCFYIGCLLTSTHDAAPLTYLS